MTDIYNILYSVDYFSSDTYNLDLPYCIYDWVLGDAYKKYWPQIKK
jgi:hypothetical protein